MPIPPATTGLDNAFSGMIGSGLFNSNAYLASGFPFLTGSTLLSSSFATNNSEVKVSFDKVVKSITVVNTSASAILVSFLSITSSNVSGGHHYFTLQNQRDSYTFNTKAREVYISLATNAGNGAFELVGELTTINPREMVALTGSGLSI